MGFDEGTVVVSVVCYFGRERGYEVESRSGVGRKRRNLNFKRKFFEFFCFFKINLIFK